MTYIKDVFGRDLFREFDKLYVGFDDQFNRMEKVHNDLGKLTNYPPYNIKKTGDNNYQVEIAVAGFSQDDISIEVTDGKLLVSGNTKHEEAGEVYLHKGISNRTFNRTFVLDDQIEVVGAEMSNGMLTISLVRVIPESKKPKKIEIKQADQPQLLTE